MTLGGTALSEARSEAAPADHRARRAPFWRGGRGAIALALWSVAGVIGAALALLPALLEGGPRGRARTLRPHAEPRRLATGRPAAGAADAAPAAAAEAREAFPG